MSQNGKRITVKMKTPNPLFEKWITEWRDKAREENSKMEFCFNNALKSLKKYPLPMESGKDCKILKGFGDKICTMLDRKLKEHKKNHRSTFDDTIIGNNNIQDGDNENNARGRKTKTLKPDKEKSMKSRNSSKEYNPKKGSGGHAILLTLYKKTLEPSYPGYLSKLELVREAQYFSDMSFTKPDPGTRYTAWSSMRTLITKNLVKKMSNPAKFSLTEDGLELAKKLYEKENGTDSNNMQNSKKLCDPIVCGVQSAHTVIDLSDDELRTEQTSSVSSVSSYESKTSVVSSGNDNYKNIVTSEPCYDKTSQRCNSSSSTTSSNVLQDSVDIQNEEIFLNMQSCVTFNNKSSTSSIGSTSEENLVSKNQPKNCKTLQRHASSSSIASSTQSCSQEDPIIFLPHTFDVILYVDTQETGRSKVDIRDDPILAELKFLSTSYEVKNLKVGDYIWICRDRTTKNELVLPYIIERKRMDDFGDSIKDGRYHEQKFRLIRSGIPNITYLIESHGTNQSVKLPMATLYQAATNTAIQDSFCIKFTGNYKETARYLANFSSILTSTFTSKMLVGCTKENLPDEVSLDDDIISLLTFRHFNKSSSKNKPLTVSDLFVKMLLQINGMSVDKALAIIREYPTPETLRKAYADNPGVESEKLLAQIEFGDRRKVIGLVLSKIIYQLFTFPSF